MARPQSPPILSQLRSARTLPEQATALRSLKNEIVGHIQKKELWISLGVLDPIVRTLATARSPAKPNGKDARFPLAPRPLSEEESVRLQALQLVACFANGGPAFLAPLHAARALPALLANISPFTNSPHLVVAALRALTDIADASALAPTSSPLKLDTLADAIFSSQHLESFSAMISISSTNHILQSQVPLAAGLISRLCREDRHQHALATTGILDALSTQLASVAVARGHVVPGAERAATADALFDAFPDPAHKSLRLRPILEAIAAILGDSKYRAHRLINSPSILAVFPPIKFEPTGETPEPKQGQEFTGFGNPRHQPLTAMEYILPINMSRALSASPHGSGVVSDSQSSSRSSLSKFSSSAIWESQHPQPNSANLDGDSDEVESPFVPWLVHLVRSSDEFERLLASSILAALIKGGVGSKCSRESTLGLLVVPLLVDMIAKNDKDASDVDELDTAKRTILEQAPVVLARMVVDSDYLQKSASDCDAVKVLSKLLKHAYTPVQDTAQPRYWSPLPDTEMSIEANTPLTQLGEDGQNSLLLHRLKVREGTLKAIAALAGGSEDYRKAFLSEEIVSYVMESLSEFPRKPKTIKERTDKPGDHATRQTATAGYGANPAGVIIAGCHVVRMLSRSVSTLRTALVDHGVALPVFRFMKHPNIDIQIAATATIINLVVEVSPVRELLTEKGVMKVLCEHAHSDNPALRLNAMWALKHFVDAVGPELKKACLEELETEYLVELICHDTEDSTLLTGQERDTGIDMDDDVEMEPSDVPHRWLYASNGLLRELDSSQSTKLRQVEDKLAAVRESELNPVRRARNDDLAIQEQGLNFIQNLIGRPEAGLSSETTNETAEMVDHLFAKLGQDRMFDILASKLRARVLHPFSRRTPVAGRETRVLHPQAKIIMAVIYILVHMAASIPRHRQLVIAQTELLKLLAQQASSKDREVRVALCHLIINLTWQEDDGEAQSCAQRAHELRKLGFHTKMETLKHQDGDLDVRERAKTAVWQIQQATY
ncbi:armadillo-type protein [Dactylonectria macrodidyma]|uniref:Armadillo-type protein n=1 Tax=Dactylonectria macrodidyma TaxID=307937 RepID=A0A9P9JC07_9HYPO|nr:armadillo-type protein [Dactylonectria macrodidyma]